MRILVYRFNSDKDHSNSVMLIDGRFQCYGIEDEYRKVKVKGETRIPDGIYKIEFRTEGGFHQRYKKNYKDWHKGMLWIKEVPGFEYILIHKGNSDQDTAGCYLVATSNSGGENFSGGSGTAYKKIYPKIRNTLLRNEKVTIQFATLDDIRK